MPWSKTQGIGRMHGIGTMLNMSKFVEVLIKQKEDQEEKDNVGAAAKKKATLKKNKTKVIKKLPGFPKPDAKFGGSKASMTSGSQIGGFGFATQ